MPEGKLPPDFYVVVVPTLFIFLALFTSPLWYNAAFGQVEWNEPQIAAGAGSECIMDTAAIRVEHMELLDVWRDEAVREGRRTRPDAQGAAHLQKSLTNTCLDCHTDRAAFCDRCHDYVGEDPYCWDCHVESGEAPRRDAGPEAVRRVGGER
jgi:hypothetical protein